ncbi:MAG: hypothetical protein ACYCQI_13740 [Gammaproteobacteria bacterium]
MAENRRLKSRIEFENALGKALFEEAVRDDAIKNILQDLAETMKKVVLAPLIAAANRAHTFAEFSTQYKSAGFDDAILKLAVQQSNERKQYGASVREKFETHKEIIADIRYVREMLNALNKALTDISKITTTDEMAKTLKAFVDLGTVYIASMQLTEKQTEKYRMLKDEIFSSSRELLSRMTRQEMGLPPVYSVRFGLGQTQEDLVNQAEIKDTKKIMEPGKAIFWGVSTEERLRHIAKKYQEVKTVNLQRAQEIKQTTLKEYGKEIAQILCPETEAKEGAINFKLLASKVSPQSERLSREVGVPMIAATSGSLARPVITLMMHEGFYSAGKIDFDKLQIFSNVIAGFFAHAGHHSITEVAETYNKTLDFILRHEKENLPKEIIKIIADIAAQEQSGELSSLLAAEQLVIRINRHYQYGDYETFLHDRYRDSIVSEAVTMKLNQKEHLESLLLAADILHSESTHNSGRTPSGRSTPGR